MTARVDFSPNAGVYDCRHGSALSEQELDRLWSVAILRSGARVLDVGAGTGRVAVPLAARGCRVVAIEPSAAMLARLGAKRGEAAVEAVLGGGAPLPFRSGSFDAVVIARLLYLTPDWRAILSEAARVLAPGGRLLHEWGNGRPGEEWVRVREEARRLFEEAGVREPFHSGVRSEAEVDRALGELGLVRDADVENGAGPAVTLREFLRRLAEGELSYVWSVPLDVRAKSLPRLQRWAEETFDLDRPVAMPRELRWTVHRRRGPIQLVALTELAAEQIGPLLETSEAEGFRFVRRVVTEWESGANRFTKSGEALIGAFVDGRLVAICGLSRDPYLSDDTVGRLRNLYVLPEHRGREIGATLTRRVIELAQRSFRILRLRAATPRAAALYERLGFTATDEVENCTHVLRLDSLLANGGGR